jgi:DNA-binding CsgD family transcriptional regulator
MQTKNNKPTSSEELSVFLTCQLDNQRYSYGHDVISFIQKPVTEFYIVIDVPNKKFLAVSPSVKDITGYDQDTFLCGGPDFWFSLYHPQEIELRKSVHAEMRRFYNAIVPGEKLAFQYSTDLKLRRFDGIYIRLLCYILCLKIDKNLQPEYILCSFADMTHIDNNNCVTLSTHKWNGCAERYESTYHYTYEISDVRLTKREKQIDQLINEGLTSKEIAQKLNLSPDTINSHRKEINRKKKGI